MQISKKGEPPKKQPQPTGKRAHPQAIIPYGKHQGASVQEVMENDSKYWQWICSEGLIDKWLLYMPPSAVKLKPQALQTGTERWISIYEVNEPCMPWDKIEQWVIEQSKNE